MSGLLTITVPKKEMPQAETTMRSLPIETSTGGMKSDFYIGNAKVLLRPCFIREPLAGHRITPMQLH